MIHTRRLADRRVLGRAIARHDLHPETDQDLMIDFLIGRIWTRLLLTRDPVTGGLIDAIVDFVMSGRPPGAPTPVPRDHVDGSVRGITVSAP